VDGGDRMDVGAFLTESTEEARVKKAKVEAEIPEDPFPCHVLKHVLLLQPRRVVLVLVPFFKQSYGFIVGLHKIEARVDWVAH